MKQGLFLTFILSASFATATEGHFGSCFRLLQDSRETFYADVMSGQGYFVYPPSDEKNPLAELGLGDYGLVAGRDFWVQRVEVGVLAVLVEIPRAITKQRLIADIPVPPSFGEGILPVVLGRLTDLETAKSRRDDVYFYRFKAPYMIQSVEFTEQGLVRVTVQASVQNRNTAKIKIRRDGGDQVGYELNYRFVAMSNQEAGEDEIITTFEINLLEGFRMGDRAIVRLDKAYEIIVGETTPLSVGEIIRSARRATRD